MKIESYNALNYNYICFYNSYLNKKERQIEQFTIFLNKESVERLVERHRRRKKKKKAFIELMDENRYMNFLQEYLPL
jgi:hypothetical protein